MPRLFRQLPRPQHRGSFDAVDEGSSLAGNNAPSDGVRSRHPTTCSSSTSVDALFCKELG